MAAERMPDGLIRIAGRVTPFELLFDLVFVFTLTQVTDLITHSPDLLGVAKALILLALVYCLYDGYIWLMNQVPPDGVATRIVLLFAMAGFLIMASAIPSAFGVGRWVFSITFLALMLVHHVTFLSVGSATNVTGILRTGPLNVTGAVILVVSAALGVGTAIWLFPLALVVILVTGIVNSRGGFNLSASHLIERHRLLMIIAFGESIVNVGARLTTRILVPTSMIGAVLAVGIVGGLWWTYFATKDQESAERRVESRDVAGRSNLAITSFYGDHLGMMFGLVLFAAGCGLLIGGDSIHRFTAQLATGSGVALFLFSQALYRFHLTLDHIIVRLVAGLFAVAISAASVILYPLAELALLLAVVSAVVVWQSVADNRRAGRERGADHHGVDDGEAQVS